MAGIEIWVAEASVGKTEVIGVRVWQGQDKDGEKYGDCVI